MDYGFKSAQFDFEYKEELIDSKVLWESHCHAQYEMISVLDGDIRVVLEGKSYPLTANQTAIIPPLLYHTIVTNKKGRYRRVRVFFDISAIPPILRPYFSEITSEVLIFPCFSAVELKKICLSDRAAFYEPLAESLMVQIFYDGIRLGESRPTANIDAALQEILDYIDAHLCEKICLDDIALHTARSKSSVCHSFEEKMKVSPKQYILQKRLALADRLMRDGVPPCEAAMRVGYENYSNFYRMYKKHFKESPTGAHK